MAKSYGETNWNCGRCVFWHPPAEAPADAGDLFGGCHRRAPGAKTNGGWWAATHATDWCGEFEPLTGHDGSGYRRVDLLDGDA